MTITVQFQVFTLSLLVFQNINSLATQWWLKKSITQNINLELKLLQNKHCAQQFNCLLCCLVHNELSPFSPHFLLTEAFPKR